MNGLIKESLDIAAKKFKGFGFSDEQIEQLLASGKRDLEKETARLRDILLEEPIDMEALSSVLHALKGLLYNMGNDTVGDMMVEMRSHEITADEIETLKKLVGIA